MTTEEPRYWDKEGKPIELLVWGSLFGDWEYRKVAFDCFAIRGHEAKVITCWLGDAMEDDFLPEPPPEGPRIFGTLSQAPNACFEMRHSTLAQARDRHLKLVAAIKAQDLDAISQLMEEAGV